MAHVAVVIDWYGPYTLEAAKKVAAAKFEGGLYLCLGRSGMLWGAFRFVRPQYVGKSDDDLSSRLTEAHHKLDLVNSYRAIWLGEIISGGVPGRRKYSTPTEVRLSEWILAHFMDLPLNEKLKEKPPDGNATVLNFWWHPDGETPHERPHKDWPDLIDYRGLRHKTRLVWFGGKMKEITLHTR